jgi:hypothetical protein
VSIIRFEGLSVNWYNDAIFVVPLQPVPVAKVGHNTTTVALLEAGVLNDRQTRLDGLLGGDGTLKGRFILLELANHGRESLENILRG